MTFEFTVPGGNSIECHTRRYELVQFHFHTPSEHTMDGEHAAIEIHLVHGDVHGNLCVVAVFGEESEAAQWPDHLTAPLHLDWLLPQSNTRYTYSGSLTMAPYTEGVDWIVLTEGIRINPEWVDRFRTCYGSNNRPIQPLNDRIVRLFAGASSSVIRDSRVGSSA
jgi:carbonic anhydrase